MYRLGQWVGNPQSCNGPVLLQLDGSSHALMMLTETAAQKILDIRDRFFVEDVLIACIILAKDARYSDPKSWRQEKLPRT